MKKIRKMVSVLAVAVLSFAFSISVFAASSYATPAEVVAAITGRAKEDIIAQKVESGKTYGTIAKEEGKLEEFKTEMLKVKEDVLKKQVASGGLTQAQADEILASVKEAQVLCDGSGSGRGAGCGLNANGQGGQGQRNGNGGGQNGAGRGACGMWQ